MALEGTKHLGAVWDLMDFHLEPKNYASFINATGSAYIVEPSKYIEKSITDNPRSSSTRGSRSRASSSRVPRPAADRDARQDVGGVPAASGRPWPQISEVPEPVPRSRR